MAAILVASVALAGWLVRRRGGAIRAGVEVLQQVRLKGLAAYWGREPVADWYLRRDGTGKPVGWWTRQRTAVEGGYRGRTIGRSGAGLFRETWTLDTAARTGTYQAEMSTLVQRPGMRVPLLRPLTSTTITYRDGEVEVRRESLGKVARATGKAPRHYVPEGLSTLVYRLTAASGSPAAFAMIFNEEAIAGGQVRFAQLRVVARGPRGVEVRYESLTGSGGEALEFDEAGRIARGAQSGGRTAYQRADFEAVRKQFPEVELFSNSDKAELKSD